MSTGRTREYALAVLLGAASAGLAVTATTGGRSWGTAVVTAAQTAPVTFVVAARTVTPWAVAAALVGLAGIGAVIATAGRWRQAVGLLVAGCGLVVLVTAGLAGGAVQSALRDEAEGSVAAADPDAIDRAVAHPDAEAWRWLAAAGGAGLTVAGGLVLARGAGWPAMGRRYEAPAATRPRDQTDLWRAQDEGEDPTA